MNDLLRGTLQAAQGGITNIDAATAIGNISSWEATLGSVGLPGTDLMTDNLSALKSALQSGDLESAAAILPLLGAQTQSAADIAPDEDVDGLNQLASALMG
ncbi:hypothetical protein [Deinococcus sp.]|uniref:hypothetical protein n=1 Tax=Deinococcus sp. TaxID=47478 RepID=UPI003B5960F0